MLQIDIDKNSNALHLQGELNSHSLHHIWSTQKKLFKIASVIDVSALTRVDSSGLAALTYFCNKYKTKLVGINAQLQALIDLYDLNLAISE